jgi:hypothetical protein
MGGETSRATGHGGVSAMIVKDAFGVVVVGA